MPLGGRTMTQQTFFTPELFRFLRELKANNEREWFQAQKDRYDADVKTPMAAFCMALDPALRRISRYYAADPRTSIFRIHRDTRFSKDKSPYKTHVGAQFRPLACAKDVHAPGFYLQLEPGNCFAATGIWRPDAPVLAKIRERIVSDTKAWKAIQKAGIDVQGEALKRIPAGFAADHPFAEDLKLKDFYAVTPFTEAEACAPDFLERYLAIAEKGAPLMRFLAEAVDLPW